MNKNNKGFTLVELVVGIILIGILSAVAIPRYINMAVDANKTALQAFKSSMLEADNFVFSSWLVNGDGSDSVYFNGYKIPVINGHPVLEVENLNRIIDTSFTIHQNNSKAGKEVLVSNSVDIASSLCYLRITQDAKTGAYRYSEITSGC